MRWRYPIAVALVVVAVALTWGVPLRAQETATVPLPVRAPTAQVVAAAETPDTASDESAAASEEAASDPSAAASEEAAAPASPEEAAETPPAAGPPEQSAETPAASEPAGEPPLAAEAAPPPTPGEQVVAIIREMLTDSEQLKDANADDRAALWAFYETKSGGPLWITEMGFSAKAQAALFEIEKADDWGLEAEAFDLPKADLLPNSPEAQAGAEIKLDLAILQYARFARGGRVTPRKVSSLYDQMPPLRDPNDVFAGIATAEEPDAYLRALHPTHDQFVRLREALLKAREARGKGGDTVAIKRLLVNMERWRWMPEDLGALHVWQNTPAFMVYVVKDGKIIYADKTQVGTIGYATPVFTADMKTIVFNPSWVAPPTVVRENILPPLSRRQYSVLKVHNLSVSLRGQPVDARKVDWARVNIHDYTFTQPPGPDNVLGKAKFLFPNRHIVYMHDTHPVRRKYYQSSIRAVGHECVRMERPEQFAAALLAEDKGWSAAKVKSLWNGGRDGAVSLDAKIPVHMTYFTAMVDEKGKLSTYADLYGLDARLATALFGDAKGFPPPPPEAKGPPGTEAGTTTSSAPERSTTANASVLQRAFRRD